MSPGSTQPSLQPVVSQCLARLRVIVDVARSIQPSLQPVVSQCLARLRVIIDVPREYTTQSPICDVTTFS